MTDSIGMSALNPRQKIIQLMRGFYSVPIICFLAREGFLQAWLKSERNSVSDFCQGIANRGHLLEYLHSLDLISIDRKDSTFCLTWVGKKILSRYGGFNIIHSYHEYFGDMETLFSELGGTFSVDREENVFGSRHAHSIKFFKDALDLVDRDYEVAVDVGCGDGCFLGELASVQADKCVMYAVDKSRVSIEAAGETLAHLENAVHFFEIDGLDVASWGRGVPSNKKGLISFWFLLHEVSRNQTDTIVELLEEVHVRFPCCDVLIGENVHIPSEILRSECDNSVAPEFLLFHRLSRQGVLSWESYRSILRKSRYRIKREIKYDIISDTGIPSSFLWLLSPEGLPR